MSLNVELSNVAMQVRRINDIRLVIGAEVPRNLSGSGGSSVVHRQFLRLD
jgi:hypothetical protein